MVCGVQGDFTRGLVEDPPKYLWTRELKVRYQSGGYWARTLTFERAGIVFWCIQHFDALPPGHQGMHWYWYRGRVVHLPPERPVVPHLDR